MLRSFTGSLYALIGFGSLIAMAAAQSSRGPHRNSSKSGGPPDVDAIFSRIDANDDGSISKREFERAHRELGNRMRQAFTGRPKHGEDRGLDSRGFSDRFFSRHFSPSRFGGDDHMPPPRGPRPNWHGEHHDHDWALRDHGDHRSDRRRDHDNSGGRLQSMHRDNHDDRGWRSPFSYRRGSFNPATNRNFDRDRDDDRRQFGPGHEAGRRPEWGGWGGHGDENDIPSPKSPFSRRSEYARPLDELHDDDDKSARPGARRHRASDRDDD